MILNFHTVTSSICAVLLLLTGTYVLSRNIRSRAHRTFMGICLSTSIWLSVFFVGYNLEISILERYWVRFIYCGIPFIFVFIFDYIISLLNLYQYRTWAKFNYVFGLVIVFLAVKTDLLVNGIYQYSWGPYAKAGPLFIYFLVYVLFLVGVYFVILGRTIADKKSPFHIRSQAKYVFIALATYAPAVLDYLPCYGINVYPVGCIPATAFVLIMAYAIVKHRLMDIKVAIKKGIVYSILVTLITFGYLLTVVISERYFQNVLGYKNSFVTALMIIAIATIFTPLKNWIQKLLDKTFFKGTPVEIAQENELLRREVVQTDRYKTLASLIDGIAHEVRGPLTSLVGYNYLLRQKSNDAEFMTKFTGVFEKEVTRISELIQNLSSYSKPKPLSLERTDIVKLINETLLMLKEKLIECNVQVYKYYKEGFVFNIYVDPSQIRQALINLLLNAIDAMPEGGQIWIGAEKVQNQFQILIKDTGCGISPENISEIFDPFFKLKEENKGLGLSIVQSIVENHSGKISVESEIEAGTEFVIKLPLNLQ